MKITYKDITSVFPHFNDESPDDEFMLNGHFTEAYMSRCIANNETISRAGDNIVPDYIVFESDSLSLDDQRTLIENLDKTYIRYITFSGNKSYHILYRIKVPEDITASEYKTIAQNYLESLDLLQYADKQTLSKSRLTRNPNGLRSNGVRQTCVFDNPEARVIDLSEEVGKLRRQSKLDEWIARKNAENRPVSDQTCDEVLSRIKKDCYAKQGYDMMVMNNFPSGAQFLSCAAGMYKVCTMAGIPEQEALSYCREYLTKVSLAHPSNISSRTARMWSPHI